MRRCRSSISVRRVFFNFDLDKYKDQLVAGYERTLPDLGLEVYMLGLDKLASGKAATAELPR